MAGDPPETKAPEPGAHEPPPQAPSRRMGKLLATSKMLSQTVSFRRVRFRIGLSSSEKNYRHEQPAESTSSLTSGKSDTDRPIPRAGRGTGRPASGALGEM